MFALPLVVFGRTGGVVHAPPIPGDAAKRCSMYMCLLGGHWLVDAMSFHRFILSGVKLENPLAP